MQRTKVDSEAPRFGRATSLQDLASLDELPAFRVTPSALRALAQIVPASSGSRDNAWAIVGPYGAGKSTLAVLVTGLLSQQEQSHWITNAIGAVQEADAALGARLHRLQGKKYLPILLQGSAQELWECLRVGLLEIDSSVEGPLFNAYDRRLLRVRPDSDQRRINLLRLIEHATKTVRDRDFAGLAISIDEFGRFLDQLHNPFVRRNLALVQDLAELSSRVPRCGLRLMVVLHQNFEDYSVGISAQERAEWSKIQGRFQQVAMAPDPSGLYHSMAGCLRDTKADRFDRQLHEDAWSRVKEFPAFAESRSEWKARLLQLHPLHPLSAFALPRLAARLGQNQRTVFSFLLSDEPHSLTSFTRRAQSTGDRCLLGLDWLCDYFLMNHTTSFVALRFRHRLAQLTYALEQLGSGDSLTLRIVKVLGLIELLESPDLRPSKGVVAAALNIGETEWEEFALAIRELTTRRLIVERRYIDELRLVPGSDFDVAEGIADAADRLRMSDFDSGTVVNEHAPLTSLVARRHSFETGTVRAVARRFVEVSRLGDHLAPSIWQEANDHSDLIVDYVFCSSSDEIALVTRQVRSCKDADRISVIPKEPLALRELLVQVQALQDLGSREEVISDPIARQEVDLHLRQILAMLREQLRNLTEPGLAGATWYWLGQPQHVVTDRDVQALVSRACDRLFQKNPRISNELINRRQLSTASVVAVKKIITGLLERPSEPGLGFEGNGPEVTIFHAVFEATGWHRGRKSTRRLAPPDSRSDIRAAWNVMKRFLDSTANRRRPLSELWNELSLRPYGIRAGLAPLLIWGALIERISECCLYERGTYVPTWSAELYDRFLRAPHEFEVRSVSQTSLPEVLVALSNELPVLVGASSSSVGVNDFLRRLFTWYKALPDHTKRSGTVARDSAEFRRILASASDPVELVFTQLPVVLRVPDSSDPLYTKRFRRVIRDLNGAYGRLLDLVCAKVAALFATSPDVLSIKAELARLSVAIGDDLIDAASKALLVRAAAPAESSHAWIESVAAVVAGQSPRFWSDQIIKDFEESLALIAHQIRQTHKAQIVRSQAGLKRSAPANWLTLATTDGIVIDDVILEHERSPEEIAVVNQVNASLRQLTSQLNSRERRSVLLDVLTKLWKE